MVSPHITSRCGGSVEVRLQKGQFRPLARGQVRIPNSCVITGRMESRAISDKAVATWQRKRHGAMAGIRGQAGTVEATRRSARGTWSSSTSENLAGTPCPGHLDVAFAESVVRKLVPDLDEVHCVVACSHRAARTVAFAFPGALRRWRSGPDGADLALLEEMSDLRVMGRFDRVTLFSGDGIFACSMAALAKEGIETTVVSWHSQLSPRLRLAAQRVVTLVDPETTFGEAS